MRHNLFSRRLRKSSKHSKTRRALKIATMPLTLVYLGAFATLVSTGLVYTQIQKAIGR